MLRFLFNPMLVTLRREYSASAWVPSLCAWAVIVPVGDLLAIAHGRMPVLCDFRSWCMYLCVSIAAVALAWGRRGKLAAVVALVAGLTLLAHPTAPGILSSSSQTRIRGGVVRIVYEPPLSKNVVIVYPNWPYARSVYSGDTVLGAKELTKDDASLPPQQIAVGDGVVFDSQSGRASSIFD